MNDVYVLFRKEFFQGDLLEQDLVGVFDTLEEAEEIQYELQAEVDALYDPTARTKYDVVPVELNTILESD